MNSTKSVAFYAPLKSPDHPSPSGDRTMARLLMKALGRAGFAPSLASHLRSLDKGGEPALQEKIRKEALAEADRLVRRYRALPAAERPCLWFTYHVYYKAPDWIGPRVADALSIPYAVAEGSRAAKRAGGPWALGHAGAEAALDRADAVFVMTALDREALAAAKPAHQALVDLPPFIDAGEWPDTPPAPQAPDAAPRLLTVAMMRDGDKLASYRLLAASLDELRHRPWTLDIAGDGEARDEIRRLFAPFGERIRFHGEVGSKAALKALYESADLFVWPAVNEAYGMVLLEAQLFGCPVVAGAFGGVASVVRHNETGLLTPPGDAAAFAQAVAMLLESPDRREPFAAAAQRFVTAERDLDHAAARLQTALSSLNAVIGA
ncbi:glycosyltransferase family 4 protein [Microvirga lenta]|uniref:glycosyltransferase family 4 protein n=1 Tax=Microvirga lenta TaxID=2881337 RepID=UPI001CFFA6F3|nr:glycosyltransferase family 4 protein [Microvirga lenta]MCB5176376.1 glycosyltransferase family 4 protein [Microvirga lenta]